MRAKILQTLKDKEKLIAKLFNDTIVALNDLSDDITQDGLDAYMIKDFDQSRRIDESVTALINFTQEVTVLSTRWKNGVFSITPTVPMPQKQLVTNVKRESKRTRTRLRVTFIEDNKGSSRFRGVSTTYSVRHNQTNVGLRYRARYAGITAPNHISRSNVA